MTTNPRERAERTVAQAETRERRRSSTLDRFTTSRLNPFARDALDHQNFVYRWFNDDGKGRIQQAYARDWEFVTSKDVKGFDPTQFNLEADGRIRQQVNPGFAYLMRMHKDWY